MTIKQNKIERSSINYPFSECQNFALITKMQCLSLLYFKHGQVGGVGSRKELKQGIPTHNSPHGPNLKSDTRNNKKGLLLFDRCTNVTLRRNIK